MFHYLGKRLLILIPSLWLLLSILFLLNKTALTQTVASFYGQESRTGYESERAESRERAFQQYLHKTGQDLPLFYFRLHTLAEPDTLAQIVSLANHTWRSFVPAFQWNGFQNQYHQWFSRLLQADLGLSLRDSRPVADIIGEALGNTLLLVLMTTFLSFILAIGLGVWLVLPNHFRWRKPVLSFLYFIDTIPLFILALLLLLALSGSGLMGIFPVYGIENTVPGDGFFARLFSQLYHLTIPVFCLTLATVPYLSNQVYRALQQVESLEYIQTARAKGLSEYTVIGKHALRNALLPLITLFTGFIPAFVGGALIIEVIFAIPGMGRLLADSVLARDNPVVLGIVLCMALVKMLSLLLADCLYYLADPRIRFR